jgi:mRNA-degrading endonuclease RelE of RelBE toxin-antitoxin system
MPKIESSQRFKDAYRNLPPEIQAKVKKALRLLAENLRHPSLQTKPIQGVLGIYEARVDQSYRMTYERLPGNVVRMRIVGKHDEALRHP